MKSSHRATLQDILESAVGSDALPASLDDDTPLLGNISSLDSMAVVAILTRIQEDMGCPIADDEVGADVFETFGSLRRFVEARLDQRT